MHRAEDRRLTLGISWIPLERERFRDQRPLMLADLVYKSREKACRQGLP